MSLGAHTGGQRHYEVLWQTGGGERPEAAVAQHPACGTSALLSFCRDFRSGQHIAGRRGL